MSADSTHSGDREDSHWTWGTPGKGSADWCPAAQGACCWILLGDRTERHPCRLPAAGGVSSSLFLSCPPFPCAGLPLDKIYQHLLCARSWLIERRDTGTNTPEAWCLDEGTRGSAVQNGHSDPREDSFRCAPSLLFPIRGRGQASKG